MTFFSAVFHLMGLLAPALGVAVLLWLGLLWRRGRRQSGGQPGRQLGWLMLLGVAVLLAGLAYFGRDGKMATYAALVLAQGTLAWRFRGA
jgi:peptidoglycan biosynthesis protein MviN/MurJ (putative lipid II flippase)